MKSKKTREKILDESLVLFNHKKSSNVSTVQISTAMNISPGNLYYYFANKEEVIRCIWKERMIPDVEKLIKELNEMDGSESMLDLIQECFRHFETFRFFYTEISTLFNNDKELKTHYQSELSIVIENITATYDKWQRNGHLTEIDDRQKKYFAINLLKLLSCSFILYDSNESDVDIVEKYVKTKMEEVIAYFEIYFVKESRNIFLEKMSKRGLCC